MSLANREYKTALGYAHLMLDTLQRITPRDEFILADAYNAIGFCYLGFEDERGGALGNLMKSMELREKYETRNPAMRGITLANIALYYNLHGEYADALKYGKRGLELVQEHLGKGSFKAAE